LEVVIIVGAVESVEKWRARVCDVLEGVDSGVDKSLRTVENMSRPAQMSTGPSRTVFFPTSSTVFPQLVDRLSTASHVLDGRFAPT